MFDNYGFFAVVVMVANVAMPTAILVPAVIDGGPTPS
jgi:hypothetical protein